MPVALTAPVTHAAVVAAAEAERTKLAVAEADKKAAEHGVLLKGGVGLKHIKEATAHLDEEAQKAARKAHLARVAAGVHAAIAQTNAIAAADAEREAVRGQGCSLERRRPIYPPPQMDLANCVPAGVRFGKLVWVDQSSGAATFLQPEPRAAELPRTIGVHEGLRVSSRVVAERRFSGRAESDDDAARSVPTGISGVRPDPTRLKRTCLQLGPEHALYPAAFWPDAVRLRQILWCEELAYNGQSRGDVPHFQSGNLYIAVADRPVRRKTHAFHHELMHMIDYGLLGEKFEAADPEWEAINPPGFTYGKGGKYMRHDGEAAHAHSAPSIEFLNRYSTSSIAEDRAEVWAALMMAYPSAIHSEPLRAKAAILKKRVAALCPALDDAWWEHVTKVQRAQQCEWEEHTETDGSGRPYFINFLTGEKRWERPVGLPRVDRDQMDTSAIDRLM